MTGQVMGKCRVDEVIGAGNMGVVYRGEHLALGVPVAVKTIKPELVANAELQQRFLQEAQLAAQLRHPNVVRVYDVGEDGDNHYIVMEYLDGPLLNQYFQQNAPVDMQTFLHLFWELASALGEAHRNGIIHRDVKPINVAVLDGPKAVLTDFGIAAALSVDTRLTTPGILMGTPAYMSPEQARGGTELDARTDVFALGIMMYEALTGVLPQMSDNVLEVLHKRIGEDIPPLSGTGATVPSVLEDVVMRAVSRDPEGRIADGAELADAIAVAYQQLFPSGEQATQEAKPQGPPRTLDLPVEETDPIADGVDLRYTDLQALLVAVEQSSTGFGTVTIHYPQWADLLLFAEGKLKLAYRWRGEEVDPLDLEQVLATYQSAAEGFVDSRAVSERYYNALRVVCLGRPTIGGLRMSFTDPGELVNYLVASGQSGVLKLQLSGQVGFVLIRDGGISEIFCSTWCQRDSDPRQSLTSLTSLLRSHPLTRLDFYALDAGALRTQDLPSVDPPFEPADAQELVAFVIHAMRTSGESLSKLFGLGSAPILDRYLELAAQEHPSLLEDLEVDEHKSPLPDHLLGRIDRLPHTGRRQVVLAAMQSLLEQRANSLRDALKSKRKLRKAVQPYSEVWKTHREGLVQRGLAAPFEPLFNDLSAL